VADLATPDAMTIASRLRAVSAGVTEAVTV
jgi:hypothetical protein